MKKNLIIILVLVFVVIAVVVWLVMSTNKSGVSVTEKTTSTGLSNFMANAKGDILKLLF